MEKNDYIKILYNEWLENLVQESAEIHNANEKIQQYIEKLSGKMINQNEINRILDYNGDCVAVYEEFGFRAGFQIACELTQLILGIVL